VGRPLPASSHADVGQPDKLRCPRATAYVYHAPHRLRSVDNVSHPAWEPTVPGTPNTVGRNATARTTPAMPVSRVSVDFASPTDQATERGGGSPPTTASEHHHGADWSGAAPVNDLGAGGPKPPHSRQRESPFLARSPPADRSLQGRDAQPQGHAVRAGDGTN